MCTLRKTYLYIYKTLCSKAVQHFKTEFVQNQTEFFFINFRKRKLLFSKFTLFEKYFPEPNWESELPYVAFFRADLLFFFYKI